MQGGRHADDDDDDDGGIPGQACTDRLSHAPDTGAGGGPGLPGNTWLGHKKENEVLFSHTHTMTSCFTSV